MLMRLGSIPRKGTHTEAAHSLTADQLSDVGFVCLLVCCFVLNKEVEITERECGLLIFAGLGHCSSAKLDVRTTFPTLFQQ